MTYEELTPPQKARIAFMRFGLGPKPGWSARVGMEPNSALEACLSEIAVKDAIQVTDSRLPETAKECTAIWITLRGLERGARLAKAMEPEVGFLERLALFWSNHFSVYQGKVPATAGLMDRKVIRPLVLGKFRDMLKAVIEHPAMLVYLDNQVSVSPNTALHDKYGWSYNENLAREILELHTLGVGGGYEQADVTNFALILTGWTVAANGDFVFKPEYHDRNNAPVTLMGKTYAQPGKAQADAVLDDLANSRATAQHISYKLVRHFVTDDPPQDMVERLTQVFLDGDGDLRKLYQALLAEPYAWTAPMNRIRLPYVWYMSVLRAKGVTPEKAANLEFGASVALAPMGHNIWQRLTPDGFPDDNYVWETPNAVRIRKDVARSQSRFAGLKTPAVAALAQDLLPGAISAETLEAIRGFGSGDFALNVLFTCPEFLRR